MANAYLRTPAAVANSVGVKQAAFRFGRGRCNPGDSRGEFRYRIQRQPVTFPPFHQTLKDKAASRPPFLVSETNARQYQPWYSEKIPHESTRPCAIIRAHKFLPFAKKT